MYRFFLLSSLFLFSCNRHLIPEETISVTTQSQFELTYNIVTFGDDKANALTNAIYKAFQNIFFIGTPNTINNIPMIEGKMSEKKVLLDNFIKSKQYEAFVSSIAQTNYSKIKDVKRKVKIETKITVNIESLRRFLKNDGVIRKFGY
jgi:hypothetical protein